MTPGLLLALTLTSLLAGQTLTALLLLLCRLSAALTFGCRALAATLLGLPEALTSLLGLLTPPLTRFFRLLATAFTGLYRLLAKTLAGLLGLLAEPLARLPLPCRAGVLAWRTLLLRRRLRRACPAPAERPTRQTNPRLPLRSS